MAPAEQFSPAGSSSYSSDTLVVGDGTWDFTKNTFLLPNLVGLNFDTMQYNGMGNRFSTIPQYHNLITAHGVLAAIVFLFIIPAAVMIARFYARKPGYAIRYHAYLQVLAVGLTTVVFILGWFAVGPNRSLTNPHHGIGVAIYVLILLQAIGGRLVRHIKHRSLRLTVHQWSGRAIAILGIIQVPLGLTLYGSPKFTFVLYTLWMTFLLLLYFIFDYRDNRHRDVPLAGGRHDSRGRSPERKSGGTFRWLGPLAAGAGAFALLRGRKRPKSRDAARSRSRSRMRSRSRPPEVIPSRRGSESYIEEEKYPTSRRRSSGGGFMNKVMAAGAAVGAGALLSRVMGGGKDRRRDEEYSAVDTDTPSRRSRLHRAPPRRYEPEYSEVSDYTEEIHRDGRRTPLLPGPGNPAVAAAAISAAESRRGTHGARPVTPRPSHQRAGSRVDTLEDSDYSSYRSPSRRTPPKSGGVGKGLLVGLGLGWFTKKMKDRRDRREEERRYEEDEQRSGTRGSRYTGDGFPSPTRREPRRLSTRRPPPPPSAMSEMSSSVIESRPANSAYGGPPMPPLSAPGGVPPPPMAPIPGPSRSRSRTRADTVEPAVMPSMPSDTHGVLHQESGSESYMSSGGHPHRRHSSRRRREGEAAAAVAAATAGRLAAEEESRRRAGRSREHTPPSQPVSVKVKVHDDRDRNVTLRRLTEEEATAARGGPRPRRNDSVSSLSGGETPSRRRYRRDSSMRRAEMEAERQAESVPVAPPAPLSPPNPAFAGGRRPKDSAYYSGPAVPIGGMAAAGNTVSSIGSPDSHGTWSGMGSPSPSGPPREPTASAADRRRRRRLERRDGRPGGPGAVETDFN